MPAQGPQERRQHIKKKLTEIMEKAPTLNK